MGTVTRSCIVRAAAVIAAVLLLSLAGACTESEPESLTFNVEIEGDAWNLVGEIVKVRQGDHLTFNLSSDVRGGFHIHGYDLFNEVAPGEPASFEFTADATGNFEIMLHKFTLASDMDHGEMSQDAGEEELLEVRLGWLQVFPR